MADYSPSSVTKASGGQETGNAGEAISAGEALYKDSSGNMKLCDVDDSTKLNFKGIALHDAALNQPITFAVPGAVVNFGTGTLGDIAVLSADGALSPSADLTSADYTVVVGIFDATSTLTLATTAIVATNPIA